MHAKKLVSVDEKIRKILETKDKEIEYLKNELNITKFNLTKTEKILVGINHDIFTTVDKKKKNFF
jgi:hypothetical protein